MSLYRKYRPQSFAEVVGQEHVTGPLLKQLTSGQIGHAYLFSGPRGTGKTSSARIFAKALNCLKYKDTDSFGEPCNECVNCIAITNGNYLDVLEIDAASNRGIDEIRDLREKIKLAPTSGRFKVYIIDEVHMLTNEAFNALLKTLEEPPEHAVFILATTELHKVPATIQSRVQKFQMELPNRAKITEKLARIAKAEGYNLPPESLMVIATVSEAAYRDAEVLLEKVAVVNPKATKEEVEKMLGNRELGVGVLEMLSSKNAKGLLVWLAESLKAGDNPKVLTENLVALLRTVLLIKVGFDEKQFELQTEAFKILESLSKTLDSKKITKWLNIFTNSLTELKDSPIPELPLELALIEACEFSEVATAAPKEVKVQPMEVTQEIKIEKKVEPAPAPTPVVIEVTPQVELVPEPIEVEEAQKLETEPNIVVPAVAAKDLDGIRDKWLDILKLVKPQNNSVEIFLRSAKAINMVDDNIDLEVGYKFHKEMLDEAKNNRILSSVFSEVLGKPVRIRVVVGERKVRPQREEPDAPSAKDETDPVEVFGKLL